MTYAEMIERTVVEPSGCWRWTRSRDTNGYGHVWMNGKLRPAHRVVYELLMRPIPVGLQLDHLCRNRACVNPAHLEPVTRRENILRGVGITAQAARRTHCPAGHPYDAANTSTTVEGGRRCRSCERSRARRRRVAARCAA